MDLDGDGHLAVALGGDDCDDRDRATHPGAEDVCGDARDQDCDGVDAPCDHDGDGVPEVDDCNDWVATVWPGADEICGDGVDQDCDGDDALCMDDPRDIDGDGHEAVEVGGDDCRDTDRAMHPGALDVCEDGIDQDCDGMDALCTDSPSAPGTAAPREPFGVAKGRVYGSGYGVPDVQHTSACSAAPGQRGGGAAWGLAAILGLLGLRRRWRRAGVVAALLWVAGCAVEDAEATFAPDLDPAFFAAYVDPVLARECSTPACHGDPARPLRLFSVSKSRATPDLLDGDLTDEELCANFRNARGFALAGDPDASLLLSKPCYLEDGGTWHGGGYHFGVDSKEYQCLAAWIGGERAEFATDGTAQPKAICDMAWNIDASGLPVRWAARPLRCEP